MNPKILENKDLTMKKCKLSQITKIYLKICKKSNKSWSKIKDFKNIYDFVFAKSSEKYFFIDLKHINDSEFKQDLWNFSNAYRGYACCHIYEELKTIGKKHGIVWNFTKKNMELCEILPKKIKDVNVKGAEKRWKQKSKNK